MNIEAESLALPEVRPFKAKIVGVGGAGAVLAAQAAQAGLGEIECLALHTNARVLKGCPLPSKTLLGAAQNRGFGTGGDRELGRSLAEADLDRIRAACADADLVFLVAGMGGGTGAGVAPVVARVARETKALVIGLAILPCAFEGSPRQAQALQDFKNLKAESDAVMSLDNEKSLRQMDEGTGFEEAFKRTNELLIQAIRGIWQMLTLPGLIRVDFPHLRSVVLGRHAECAFASAEANGETRAREAVEKLLASPFLDEGAALAKANHVLVSLLGGPDMTIADVNKVMDQLRRSLEGGRLVMGAAFDEAYRGRISITVVACKTPEPRQPAPEASAPLARRPMAEAPPQEGGAPDLDLGFFEGVSSDKPAPRYLPPPPSATPERAAALFTGQGGRGGRSRKAMDKLKQGQLALEIVSRGRFEKSEPTIHNGEDLDVPTYVRRGAPLN